MQQWAWNALSWNDESVINPSRSWEPPFLAAPCSPGAGTFQSARAGRGQGAVCVITVVTPGGACDPRVGQKQLFSDLWFFCPTTVSDLSPCLTKQIKWKMKDLLHTEIPMCHWYLVLIQFLYKFDLNWTSREVSYELCNVKLKSWDGLEQWRKAKFVETICFIKSPTFLCVSVGCWLGSIMSGTTANANILWRFPAKVPPYYT